MDRFQKRRLKIKDRLCNTAQATTMDVEQISFIVVNPLDEQGNRRFQIPCIRSLYLICILEFWNIRLSCSLPGHSGTISKNSCRGPITVCNKFSYDVTLFTLLEGLIIFLITIEKN